MNPNQNPGTEMPSAAKICIARSHRVPALHAAKTPSGIPIITAKMPPMTVRLIVGLSLVLTSSATVLPEYIVNRWTKNITVEEDTWIYTNIAYKLQALGYQVPPDKIYKNKADLLAICG